MTFQLLVWMPDTSELQETRGREEETKKFHHFAL